MADEKKLRVVLEPIFDEELMKKALEDFNSKVGSGASLTAGGTSGQTSASDGQSAGDKSSQSADGKGITDAIKGLSDTESAIGEEQKAELSEDKESKRGFFGAALGMIGTVGGVMKDVVGGMLSGMFDILSLIWEKVFSSSKMLQAVFGLFDTVVMLFFMPIGNLIAMVLMPIMADMLKSVATWSKDFFSALKGGGDFGEMITLVLVKAWDTFIVNGLFKVWDVIYDALQGAPLIGGLLEAVDSLFKWFEENGTEFLTSLLTGVMDLVALMIDNLPDILGAVTWVMNNLSTVLPIVAGVLGAILGALIAMHLGQAAIATAPTMTAGLMGPFPVATISTSTGGAASLGLAMGAGAIAGGMIGAALGMKLTPGFEEGGVVYPDGTHHGLGVPIRVSEREPEAIIPLSKMNGMGSTTNLYVNANLQELATIVEQTVAKQMTYSMTRL